MNRDAQRGLGELVDFLANHPEPADISRVGLDEETRRRYLEEKERQARQEADEQSRRSRLREKRAGVFQALLAVVLVVGLGVFCFWFFLPVVLQELGLHLVYMACTQIETE